jgi:hypothetical protein
VDSILQTEKECYITGATSGLHKHHVYTASRRKASDKWGCWVWLRADWHNLSDYGVHFNKDLDTRLKRECQERFEKLYGHEKFMSVFGKNFL